MFAKNDQKLLKTAACTGIESLSSLVNVKSDALTFALITPRASPLLEAIYNLGMVFLLQSSFEKPTGVLMSGRPCSSLKS